jgi:hypothetical protein
MKRIIQANIDRFKRLLASETDATKRVTLFRLLGEEEEKLAAANKTPDVRKLSLPAKAGNPVFTKPDAQSRAPRWLDTSFSQGMTVDSAGPPENYPFGSNTPFTAVSSRVQLSTRDAKMSRMRSAAAG